MSVLRPAAQMVDEVSTKLVNMALGLARMKLSISRRVTNASHTATTATKATKAGR